ncbi:hypothetical protein RIF29_23271 [Crotalaria pallida]|uniref:TAFII28-like protein domain-containing protein n=1 Tax=Crotalaria pallida TaxID=3830 RepID=A0AAN9FEC1_CROPI
MSTYEKIILSVIGLVVLIAHHSQFSISSPNFQTLKSPQPHHFQRLRHTAHALLPRVEPPSSTHRWKRMNLSRDPFEAAFEEQEDSQPESPAKDFELQNPNSVAAQGNLADQEDDDFSGGKGKKPATLFTPASAAGTSRGPVATANKNKDDDDDDDDEEENMDVELGKVPSSGDPDKMTKMQAILSQFTEEQMSRYESFRRAGFQKANMKRLLAGITGTQKISVPMTIVVSGIAKLFVGEVVETARIVMKERKESGPIRPCHLREAYRRLKLEGKVFKRSGLRLFRRLELVVELELSTLSIIAFQLSSSSCPSSSSSSSSSMAKKPVKYWVVDAFTESAFKGNPAAVCLFDNEESVRDQKWMQAVAKEFNISQTCYLTPVLNGTNSVPCFHLRWFTPVTEVKLCGHATLAAAHTLYSSGLVDTDVIEFLTLSGVLTAKKLPAININNASNLQNGGTQDGFFELDFPADPITEFNLSDTSQISEALNGASIIDLKRTQIGDDLLIVVASGTTVTELQPQLDAIVKIPGRGIIVSAVAPSGSGFDFFSRFFCPKFGINEDPVCGTAHCALASYWSKKLGKCDLNAYQASPRGGALNIHLDEQKQRVLLRGKAVTVMEGCLLV